MVFDSIVGDNVVILHNATVRAVEIPPGKVISDGQVVVSQENVEELDDLTPDLDKFKSSVINANVELVEGYSSLSQEA
ncbi:MAG: hypothetical protein R2741_08370 [Methanolobus sp.]